MNQKNLEYLEKQLLYTGFGEHLKPQLKDKIEKQPAEFTLLHKAEYGKDQIEATLSFKKSTASDLYFFNKYDLALKKEQASETKQTFYISNENSVTLKEGYNLMSGRAVYKEFEKMSMMQDGDKAKFIGTGEKYNAWMQLDLKQPDAQGNFKQQRFHENYGFNLKESLEKLPIKELSAEISKARLIDSLERGNRQSVTFINDGREQPRLIEANPQYKSITVYNSETLKVERTISDKTQISEKEIAKVSHDNKAETVKTEPKKMETKSIKNQPKRGKNKGQSI